VETVVQAAQRHLGPLVEPGLRSAAVDIRHLGVPATQAGQVQLGATLAPLEPLGASQD